jgi:hypothetical protein
VRVRERGLRADEIELMIEHHHSKRGINRGRAQWRIVASVAGREKIVVIYDHPHGNDAGAVRIVSAWPL